MKSILSLAALCTVVALGACHDNKTKSASPGALGEKNSCCANGSAACCKDKAAKDGTAVAPGAVGDAKSGCCSQSKAANDTAVAPGAVGDTKAGCGKVCPVTGKAVDDKTVSPGAVSDAPAPKGCCSHKAPSNGG